MALYVQPYNPWREQLAGSILAPLLKLAIGRWQEAEQNRKENAFVAEAMKEFQPQVDTSMPTLPALQDPQASQPSSPWAQAADSRELTQGFSPGFEAQVMGAGPRGMGAIQQALAGLQSSPRFNMLNPDRTRQLLAPMMEQYATAENARRMQDFFAQFGEKQDPFERLVHMARGAGAKYLPDNAVTNYVDLYKHQNPHQKFEQVNSGDKVTGYSFNPSNGLVSTVLSQSVGMTPYQQEQAGIGLGRLGLDERKFDEGIRQFDANYDLNERKFEETKAQNAFTRGLEEKKSLHDEGKMTDIGKALDKNLQYRIGEARREIKTIDDSLFFLGDSKERAALEARKAELEAQIDANMRLQWEQMYSVDPNNPIVQNMGKINGYLPRDERPVEALSEVNGSSENAPAGAQAKPGQPLSGPSTSQQEGSKAISPQEYQALKDRGFTDEQIQHYGYVVR